MPERASALFLFHRFTHIAGLIPIDCTTNAKGESCVTEISIYDDIARRTGGDIYIGIVGPVRTGKSTFIKRFMETLVLPHMEDVYVRERAKDELPQSGSGRTIMTAEPKFVPEDAASITLDGNARLSVRLIDCVGYMIPGAAGRFEGENERMVTTPWYDHEISISEAAELGTTKVIQEHSTIGLVITTDGSICDIPRQDYAEAEERVVRELQAIGKPFVLLLNSANPESDEARALQNALSEKYAVDCVCVNCLTLTQQDIAGILEKLLYAFPITALGFDLPDWIDALPLEHPLRMRILTSVAEAADGMEKLRDVKGVLQRFDAAGENSAELESLSLGTGSARANVRVPRALYYETISEQSGFEIRDDGDLMSLLTEMKDVKQEYDRVRDALEDVREHGYGIVMPTNDELVLEEPEIVRHGGRYSVRLRASAPSIHMIKADIETEVSPALGGEKASEDVINFLLQGFEGDVSRIWESNIFGKSLYDIAGEGLTAKIRKMPEESQAKLREALQRIINEGSGGLLFIIL